MNTSFNFNVGELQALNNSVNTTREEINATIKSIEGCLDELQSNITGTSVNSSINSIATKLDAVNVKMVTAFQSLSDFLNSQMKNYSTTYDTANTKLKNVLDFINQVY